jgi:hypothetical protein
MSLKCFGFASQQTKKLKLLVAEQTVELERQRQENANLAARIEAHSRAEADGAENYDAACLIQKIRDSVVHFFNHRDLKYVEQLFKKHANQATNLMAVNSLRCHVRAWHTIDFERG